MKIYYTYDFTICLIAHIHTLLLTMHYAKPDDFFPFYFSRSLTDIIILIPSTRSDTFIVHSVPTHNFIGIMKEGNFEVFLVGNDEKPLEESEGFILARSDKEYSVCVRVHRDMISKKFPFHSSYVKVGCYVDGVDVQYWKRLNFTAIDDNVVEVKFWGFKQDTQQVKAFVFAVPKSAASLSGTHRDDNISLGQIRVVFFEAEISSDVFSNCVPTGKAQTAHYTTDTKKFWQQASLSTVSGRVIEKESFRPVARWNNLHKDPSKTVVVNYHTPEMFSMMKTFESHEAQNKAASSSGESCPNKRSVVDLSNDDDGDNNVGGCNDGSSKHQKREDEESGDEDDIQVMPTVKDVPLLDISGDVEVWSAVRLVSNGY